MDLSFLSNVSLDVVAKVAPAKKETAAKLPETSDFRLFSNGKLYPSKAFAEANNLEFASRQTIDGKVIVTGNGLDVFSSKDWGMIMGKLPVELIFCAVVPKSLPKVDLFASTKYEDDGTPKASVYTQGSSVFSKETLLPMVADIYNIDWNVVDYVDMSISTANVMTSPNGVYHLPKVVSAGPHKGENTYVRRENLTICPLVVTDTKYKSGSTPAEVAATPVTATEVPAEAAVETTEAVEETVTDPTMFVEETAVEAPVAEANATTEAPANPFLTPAVSTPAPTLGDDWAAGLGINPNSLGQ